MRASCTSMRHGRAGCLIAAGVVAQVIFARSLLEPPGSWGSGIGASVVATSICGLCDPGEAGQ